MNNSVTSEMNIISELITLFDPKNPNFRPTEIYNENWLLKLVFHQASTINDEDYFLGFLPKSTWFSEGLLPTAFKARFQGDPLSESRTNADGVIGQIKIGVTAKADLELAAGANQFTVVEAKVGSPLSPGTRNAEYFDQAARNVVCIAEVIARADIDPSTFDRLDFIILAPQYSIDNGTFSDEMNPVSIRAKVQRRVDEYDGQMDSWYSNYFEPTYKSIRLHSLSWESAMEWIGNHKPEVSVKLKKYYKLCLEFK
jgi:hypothetical protein